MTVYKETVRCFSCVKHLSGPLQTMHTSISYCSSENVSF